MFSDSWPPVGVGQRSGIETPRFVLHHQWCGQACIPFFRNGGSAAVGADKGNDIER